jgi:uncharacterized protein YqhQ
MGGILPHKQKHSGFHYYCDLNLALHLLNTMVILLLFIDVNLIGDLVVKLTCLVSIINAINRYIIALHMSPKRTYESSSVQQLVLIAHLHSLTM